MLANFASPWNCIYSAAKLAETRNFPKTHILGTGPFVFVEHVKGNHWRGRALGQIFPAGQALSRRLPGRFHDRASGDDRLQERPASLAEFRGITPAQRDELVEVMGDRVDGQREPVAVEPAGRLQHQTRAVRRCAGAARAVAGDRPLGRGGRAAEHDLSEICRRR